MTDDELRSNRARVVAATDNAEDCDDSPVEVNRVRNFFFHNKFALIVALFIIAVVAFSVWNHFASDKSADINAIYAGPSYLTANDGKALAAAIRSIGGDEAPAVAIMDFRWYSQFDLDNMSKAEAARIDLAENQAEYDRYQAELTNSDALLLFVSPQLASQIESALVPLEEIFGDAIPESASGKYTIRLGDTPFWQHFADARELAQNTRICVRRADLAPAVKNGDRGAELQASAAAVVKAIAEWKE